MNGWASHRRVGIAAFLPGALHPGLLSLSRTRALRPPILSDRPYRRTRHPGGFHPHSERIAPPLRKGSTLPRGRTALHRDPFGQKWSRRLSALLQPGTLPVRGIQPVSPFGFTGRALCGRFPDLHRFAEWAFPSAQRLGQSCIPLKRIAGFGDPLAPHAARSKPDR